MITETSMFIILYTLAIKMQKYEVHNLPCGTKKNKFMSGKHIYLQLRELSKKGKAWNVKPFADNILHVPSTSSAWFLYSLESVAVAELLQRTLVWLNHTFCS